MDAGAVKAGITAGLKAHAVIADAAFDAASRLAVVKGADDVVLPMVTRSLADVAASLDVLAGREAQTIIGPRVNNASMVLTSIRSLGETAGKGTAPATDAFNAARTQLGQLTRYIASLG